VMHSRLIDRYFQKIIAPSWFACWMWRSTHDRDGYAKIKVNGENAGAYRVAYELAFGPVAKGLELDHLCRVRGCVNPLHVEPVTPLENNRRGMGPTAVNARKTECVHGHPFDAANTRVDRNTGSRVCRACVRDIQRRRRERRRRAEIERRLSEGPDVPGGIQL
jgi:hypothetical protein